MHIWHDTVDAPRRPRRVSPGELAEITVGTWPIGVGQSVLVTWEVVAADGARREGATPAVWHHNDTVNSSWTAPLGPFAEGDEVTYTVQGASPDGEAHTPTFAFRVKPALYISWLWHQHQPLYRDPAAADVAGSYRAPWVRLHALRDYYSMAALAAQHDVHVTFNLTPVLLRQIDDYLLHGASDAALDLTRRPAESLHRAQTEDLLSTFFDADWHHQIFVHARYRQLFEQRMRGDRFSRQDLRDLQMWFNLAWFGHEFRTAAVRLTTGETVDVARFVRQQRGFTHADVLAMVDEQYKLLRAVVPIHRALQEAGRIEVSTTPAFHPILPLLIDTTPPGLVASPEGSGRPRARCPPTPQRWSGRTALPGWPRMPACSRDPAGGAIAPPNPRCCANRTARCLSARPSRSSSETPTCPMASGFATGNTRTRRPPRRTSSRPSRRRSSTDWTGTTTTC
jgi:Glycosyl hydrolase family 57